MLIRLVRVGILIALTLLPISAVSAMYAYVDARGVYHYANVPGDGRYKLVAQEQPTINSPEDQLTKTIIRRSGNGLYSDGLLNDGNSSFRNSGYALSAASYTINRYIQLAAANHQVDPLLIKAVIKTESNFDPTALSPKGAQGLMQLMPGTAKDMGVNDPFDPLQNINGGTKYLKYLLDNFKGNVELGLAAYNAGLGNVIPYGVVPRIPETQHYVAQVMKTYRSYRDGHSSVLPHMNVKHMVTVN